MCLLCKIESWQPYPSTNFKKVIKKKERNLLSNEIHKSGNHWLYPQYSAYPGA